MINVLGVELLSPSTSEWNTPIHFSITFECDETLLSGTTTRPLLFHLQTVCLCADIQWTLSFVWPGWDDIVQANVISAAAVTVEANKFVQQAMVSVIHSHS
jgi:hypothetical protein